jgi:hypothetical protein
LGNFKKLNNWWLLKKDSAPWRYLESGEGGILENNWRYIGG